MAGDLVPARRSVCSNDRSDALLLRRPEERQIVQPGVEGCNQTRRIDGMPTLCAKMTFSSISEKASFSVSRAQAPPTIVKQSMFACAQL